MATVTDLSGLQPTSPEMMGLNRQREMAKALMQQSLTPAQGQMVSGHYVANPWGNIANVFSAYQGKKLAEDADTKQTEMAEALRKQNAEDLSNYTKSQYGYTQNVQQDLNAVPKDDEGNVLPQATQTVQQQVAPNPEEAMRIATQSRNPLLQQLMAEELKGMKLGEGEKFIRRNPLTGQAITVAEGGEKFRAPMTIDTGNGTLLLDARTNQQIGFIPKVQSGAQSLEASGKLRDDFMKQAQPHIQTVNAHQKIMSAPDTAQGDTSKIFGYMKVLDPGSTVREGEFATVQNSAGWTDRMRNLYNKALSGQRLTPNQRLEIDEASTKLVISQEKEFQKQAKFFTDIAKRNKITVEDVIMNPYADLQLGGKPAETGLPNQPGAKPVPPKPLSGAPTKANADRMAADKILSR